MKLARKLNKTLLASILLCSLGVSILASAMFLASPFKKSTAETGKGKYVRYIGVATTDNLC